MKHRKGYLITECSQELALNESSSNGEKSLYVTGIFSSFGRRNNNGRVYEEKIMKREVDKIMEKIERKCLWGELGHPACVFGDTEILTSEGWKEIQNIGEDETIATLNPNTKEIEYHQIKNKVVIPHNGKMVRFKGRQVDMSFTPEHRHLLMNRYDKPYFETSEVIKDSTPSKHNKSYIPKVGRWINESDITTITFKGLDKVYSANYTHSVDIEVDLMTYVRFMGIWLAEGCVTKDNHNHITIFQNEGPKADLIREMLKGFPSEMNWKEKNTDGKITFSLSDGRLANILKPLGSCYTKYIPNELKGLSVEYLEELLYWFGLGDGRGFLNDDTKKDIFSTSEKLIDDFHEVAFKCGISAKKTVEICDADYVFADRIIKSENKSPLYFLKIYTTKGIYVDKRFMNITEEDYNGLVYCVQVTNENFYVRNKDSVSFFTGNCPEINPDLIALKVESLEWNGQDLYGKAKILDTPRGMIAKTLIKEGAIGISSRGLGTVSEDGAVNENYNLITWDLVTDPSNKPSWMTSLTESKLWDMDEVAENEMSLQEAQEEYFKYLQGVICNLTN